ncbi:hypothetical protein ACIQ6R_06260 [Streptomyces sp. NPDC096048]|uniref:hypothetical protein n=1 Tax=Streptomyces sp. NPDC096048 TaxID=3366072 RepID=UPI00382EB038
MSPMSADARAVVAAVDRLTTQAKAIADALSTSADAPTTTADDGPRPDFTSPLSGIEVRQPCPFCPPPAMIPRRLFAEHVAREHKQQAPADDGVKRSLPFPYAREVAEDEAPMRAYLSAPAADGDQQRAIRRERLHNLLARADRGTLTSGEVAALRDLVDAEIRGADQLRAGRATWKAKAEEIERDRDSIAAALELAKERARKAERAADLLADAHRRAEQAEELLSIAHETSNRSETERARAVQRADIAETELRVLRAGLRANGADPTQIQNLWAQIRLRNRQWRDAKGERDQAQAALERVRAMVDQLHADAAAARTDGYETSALAIEGSARRITYALDGTEQPTTKD